MSEPDAVVVRDLTEADWAQVWSIIEQVVRAGDTFPFPTDLSETVAREIWLDNGPGGRASVAVVGDDLVVGTAKMGRNRPGPGAHVATASYMVTRAARGRGVGRSLVVDSLAWARESGYAAMQFNAVVETNRPAIGLYESLGFVVVGTVPRAHELPTGERVGLSILHVEL
ncbi:GCN5 family acetyltransferase [Humibacillus sp. DSM 29435]|uniref:GNAT family N-acetyltransferase n=1 Tax=Humibacillus sp. DSM 29435 TaxID=1869167 RepID=UPI00087299B5|nr:GNAT family N-acetyltransferase [Humibacillus sp. DSM 29435]OFE15369.1 GCN5 family acetyltransferase [Humibacillus sp. DSM 29435]